MAEPRDQGGLEYLVKAGKLQRIDEQDQGQDVGSSSSSSSSSSSQAPTQDASNVDQRLQGFAARVVLAAVQTLDAGPPARTGVRLSEISNQVQMAADVLIPLARRLESAGALKTLESDSFGDLLVTLTDEGARLLTPEASSELIQRITAS